MAFAHLAQSGQILHVSNNRENPQSPESHESLYRRLNAAEALQCYEKLSWHAFLRCEVRVYIPPPAPPLPTYIQVMKMETIILEY